MVYKSFCFNHLTVKCLTSMTFLSKFEVNSTQIMSNSDYTFEIIPKSWAKRRKLDAQIKPVSINIPDFQLKEQHFCNMEVTYEDGSVKRYYSRVLRHHKTGQWTVDGMHVAVKVLCNSN